MPPTPPMPSNPPTILVADDEPTLLRLLEFVLQKQGYRLLTAGDGDTALEMIREFRPALVVLDVMMPRRDGYEVVETLRADPEFVGLPIVMLTAKAQDEDVERGMAAGADRYITKPFEPQHLAEVVTELLTKMSSATDE